MPTRSLRALRREVFRRRLPHGLVSPAYLWPGGDPRVRLHRQLWWHSGDRWPRPVWLLIEFWLWLRWVTWYAVPACRRTLLRMGTVVETEEGISRRTQAMRILRLALLWCIPPGESYRYGLYRAPQAALNYVFDVECVAYHASRSAPLGLKPESLQRLQDKARLADELSGQGISTVPTLAYVAGGSNAPPLATLLSDRGRVFCKTNIGNRGRGAFTAWVTPEGRLAGHTLDGRPIAGTDEVEAAWRQLLSLGTALLQPCLENHPILAPLACTDEAITVRFISQWVRSPEGSPSLHCLGATLEVPAGLGAGGHPGYVILPINPENGALGPPRPGPQPDAQLRDALRRVQGATQAVTAVPDWPRLVDEAYRAHRLFPDVRAIAWDWVLSPSGPILLEGNSGWGPASVQLFRGGFLEYAAPGGPG